MIRRAEEKDTPQLEKLLRQVGQVHHEIRPDIFCQGCQKYDTQSLKQLLKDETRPIFVSDQPDGLAGYCFCVVKSFDDRAVSTPHTEIYIDDLCVDEEHRGQGVATELYRYVLDYAKALGCAFVTLNVWCGNENALAFYDKMGLTPRSITLETKV